MTTSPHTSVLSAQALTHLAPRPGGLYCDGTVGAAGHSRAILAASAPDGRLIAIDRDRDALDLAARTLEPFGDRVTFVHGRFADIRAHLSSLGIDRIDGILIDIGVSSMQLDRAERGFSFSRAGPLDMRMDPSTGETALELLRRLSVAELSTILRDFGEERQHRRISTHIKEAIRQGNVTTTADLAEVVARALPEKVKRHLKIHPATRTFQAIRIAVNDELSELATFLDQFPALLAPGGRCVVITFHSLEDRLVKRRFRELAWTSSLPPDLARKAGERIDPVCRILTKKPVVADDTEVRENPRARSAKLRACEKV